MLNSRKKLAPSDILKHQTHTTLNVIMKENLGAASTVLREAAKLIFLNFFLTFNVTINKNFS